MCFQGVTLELRAGIKAMGVLRSRRAMGSTGSARKEGRGLQEVVCCRGGEETGGLYLEGQERWPSVVSLPSSPDEVSSGFLFSSGPLTMECCPSTMRAHLPHSTQLTSDPTQPLCFTCHRNSPRFSQVFMYNYHNTLCLFLPS